MYEQTTSWMNSANPIVLIIVLLLIAVIHFLPSLIAFSRGHDKRLIILLLNVFLGWTVIVWVVLMVWATKGSSDGILKS